MHHFLPGMWVAVVHGSQAVMYAWWYIGSLPISIPKVGELQLLVTSTLMSFVNGADCAITLKSSGGPMYLSSFGGGRLAYAQSCHAFGVSSVSPNMPSSN